MAIANLETVKMPAEDRYSGQTARNTIIASASLLASVLLAAAVILLFVVKSKHSIFESGIHPYLIYWAASTGDTAGQRAAHRFILLGAALLTITGPWLLAAIRSKQNLIRQIGARVAVVVSLLFFASAIARFAPDWLAVTSALCSLTLLLCLRGRLKVLPLREIDYVVLSVVFVVLAIIPGLIRPLDMTGLEPYQIVDVQQHYSTVVATGDRLALGQKIFADVRQHYGVVFQTLAGIWQAHVRTLSFGEYAQIVRTLMAIFLVSVCIEYKIFARKAGPAAFVALLFVLPWVHTNQNNVMYPNLSAWRLIGIPVCFGTLLALRRLKPLARTAVCGALSCLLTAINLETGIALSLGVVAFIACIEQIADWKQWKKIALHAAVMTAGFAVTTVALLFIAYLGLGYWPDLASYFSSLRDIVRVQKTGYGGIAFAYEPVAWLILAHSLYALIKLSLQRAEQMSYRDAFRVATCVTSLVWFTYYFNRPNLWYFHSQFIIYGFLLCDLCRSIRIHWRKSDAGTEPFIVLAAALSLVIVPQTIESFRSATALYQAGWERVLHKRPKGAKLVSGVWLKDAPADALARKAAFLAEEGRKGPVVYFTCDTIFMRKLSGFSSAIKLDDPYQELIFDSQTDSFLKDLVTKSPRKIYFDDPNDMMSGDDMRKQCFLEMKARLSAHYKLAERKDGWEVWQRI